MKASEARATAIERACVSKQNSPAFDRINELIQEAVSAGKMSVEIPMRSVKYKDWMITILQLDGYKCIKGKDCMGYCLTIKW